MMEWTWVLPWRPVIKLVYSQGGVTPQSSVLPPATAVKHKVKRQEAKIIKVKGQAWFLKESRVKRIADSIVYKIICK